MRFAIALVVMCLFASLSAHGQTRQSVERSSKTYSGCAGVEPDVMYGDARNVVPILPSILPRLGYKWRGNRYVAPHGKATPIASGILTAPKHGKMTSYDQENHLYWYEADPEYLGRDLAILWVQLGDKMFKLRLRIDVVSDKLNDEYCGRTMGGEDHP